MKKIFTLIAAAFIAASANAQTEPATYYFDNQASTYTLNYEGNGFTATTYTMDNVDGYALNVAAGVKGIVGLAANPDVFFEYTNSSAKNNVVKTGKVLFVADSKNFVLNVKNLKADDEVYLLYSAKGGTAASITNADNANTIMCDDSQTTNANKASSWEEAENMAIGHVKAAANGGVKIKEVGGGMRVFAVSINQKPEAPAPTAIKNVNATPSVKVAKTIENGQLVIKNAKGTFNATGAQMK